MGWFGDGDTTDMDHHLNLKDLSKKASWAIAHELGHNVQWMTGFGHSKYGETTNNMWSIYVYQKVSFDFASLSLSLSLSLPLSLSNSFFSKSYLVPLFCSFFYSVSTNHPLLLFSDFRTT
jgi:hypothetical protein